MSYREYIDHIKVNGQPRTSATDKEVALNKKNVLKAVELLEGSDVVILGGDVYKKEDDGYYRPTYDNWYYNMDGSLDKKENAQASHIVAMNYLSSYKENEASNIQYVLVLDE